MMEFRYAIFHTSFGYCGIVFGNSGIRRVFLPGMAKGKLKKIISTSYKDILEDTSSIKAIIKGIGDYFDGKDISFGYHLDMSAMTEFQKKVCKKTMEIHFGNVRPYQWIAEKIGVPGGARAVGNALSKNPIPLIIPCHRVVGCNGNLGGFSGPGGISLKKKMLGIEGVAARRGAVLRKRKVCNEFPAENLNIGIANL